jgi:hypothetical protein
MWQDGSMGKTLVLVGAAIVGLGVVALIFERLGIHLGKLPGDIRIEGKKGSFYFPLVTCIVLSVVASLLWSLFGGRK